MKVFQIINFIAIALILVVICLGEEFTVSYSLEDVQNRCYAIEKIIDAEKTLKNRVKFSPDY